MGSRSPTMSPASRSVSGSSAPILNPRATSADQALSPFGAAAGFAVLALPAFATWRLMRSNTSSDGSMRFVRLPSSGFQPIITAGSLMVLPTTLSNLGLPYVGEIFLNPGTTAFLVSESVLVVALCVLFSLLFHLPGNVKRIAGRAPDRSVMVRSIAASAAYLLALVFASHVAPQILPGNGAVDVLSIAVVTAVILDLWAELRAPDGLVSVWPIHQLYGVECAVHALRGKGIQSHARGVHHRTLLQFYGPHVPVELRVAAEDAERAREVLKSVFCGKDGRSGA